MVFLWFFHLKSCCLPVFASLQVLAVTANGSYDLDVKPDVCVDRLRSAPVRSERPAPGDPGSPSHRAPVAPVGTLAPVPGLPEPVQLLRYVRRGGLKGGYRLEVCPEALAALEAMGQRPVVAVALCGPAQSGKTYLANHLLDRPQQGQQAGEEAGMGGL